MTNELEQSNWMADFLAEAQSSKDVEESWLRIKDMLHKLRDKYVPYIKPSSKPKWIEKGCIPLDAETRKLIKDRRKNHRIWMKSVGRTDENLTRLAFVKSRNKVNTVLRQCKRRFERTIALNAKTQPRLFWAHTRRKLKTNIGVASLLSNKNDENSIKHQDREKANILQRQFCSVFTDEPSDSIPPFSAQTDKSIINFEVTSDMVKDYLGKLNANKSCGPDDLHPRILKEVGGKRYHLRADFSLDEYVDQARNNTQ